MLKQVSTTIASRVFTTVMNLLVMVLAGHALGASGLGVISLVVLGITLVTIVLNLIGGGAIVQLVPRALLKTLLLPAYAWAALAAVLCYAVLDLFPQLVPEGYAGHICILAAIQALYSANLSVVLGQQRIAHHNAITAGQSACLLAVFTLRLWSADDRTPMAYVEASYASFGFAVIASALSIHWRKHPSVLTDAPVQRLIEQGVLIQCTNAMQLVSYRIAYWIIEAGYGKAALGLYSVANQLAEGAWIAPRSMGLVLLSKVSNLNDADHKRRLTLITARIAMGVALVIVLPFVLMPDRFYQWVFGEEISGVQPLVLLLTPGVLAMSASQSFSHFFSGSALNQHNLFGSGLGMVAILLCAPILIPRFGLAGAALSATVAYTTSVLYQIIIFHRVTGSMWKDILPHRADLALIAELRRKLRA